MFPLERMYIFNRPDRVHIVKFTSISLKLFPKAQAVSSQKFKIATISNNTIGRSVFSQKNTVADVPQGFLYARGNMKLQEGVQSRW